MKELLAAVNADVAAPDVLLAPKARALALQLVQGELPYAQLVECRAAAEFDAVILDVAVEVVQRRLHDIQAVERLAVVFDRSDHIAPEVLALREDFPVTPHQLLRPPNWPRSLCLFEERYRDLKARWTPARFVMRLREWLRLTARGELHAPDQPLEPLLSEISGTIILPHNLLEGALETRGDVAEVQPLSVGRVNDNLGRMTLVAEARGGERKPPSSALLDFVAAVIVCEPQRHSIIVHAPHSLGDLHHLLVAGGVDLLGVLRDRLLAWKDSAQASLNARLALIVLFPKTRVDGGTVEATDVWTFITGKPIRDIGVDIGRWAIHGTDIGMLVPADLDKTGIETSVAPFNPVFSLSRSSAARLNGHVAPSDLRLTAVGCGALGSQVVMNAVRGAFGRWVLVDDDLLLPHNLARHALDASAVGWSKAEALSAIGNQLTAGENSLTAIAADILAPGVEAAAIDRHLSEADIIVDMSASVTVARHLASDAIGGGRRVSMFLNPSGSDLTVLAEDDRREFPLDALEMQYYRALVRDELAGHLQTISERVRYARSCRDVSAQLPQEFAALHGAVGARALRTISGQNSASIRVWRADPATLATRVIEIAVDPVISIRGSEWAVRTDRGLVRRLAELRAKKLPNETGGVLIGAFDLERKIAYVVDTIPSPPDSKEWPVLYIRGCYGLPEQLQSVEDRTMGQLHYIGEWHSHPEGYGCQPSVDDMRVFTWLTEHMDADGLPALMMIVGDGDVPAIFLGRISDGKMPTLTRGRESA